MKPEIFNHVSPGYIKRVTEYILDQEAHHKKMTYQEEYIEFLHEHGIEYDLRY